MKKIKICLVSDTWFPIIGGGTQVVFNYARILSSKYPVNLTILTRNFPDSKKSVFYGVEKELINVKILKFQALGNWDNLLGRLLFIFQSFFHLLFTNYDVIHAFPFISGLPAFIAGKIKGIPVIFSVFALKSLSGKNNPLTIDLILEDFFCKKIPYQAVFTDNLEFFKKYKRKQVFYIPNGVNLDIFNKIKVEKLKFPHLLYVGRFHQQKGLLILLQSVKTLVNVFPFLTLTMVGWGPEKTNIQKYIKKNSLSHCIDLREPLFGKDLAYEYKKAHLFVLPSLYEGQGIVILESWASSLPVVASRTNNMTDLIKDNVNGYLVVPGSASDLTKVIKHALLSKKRVQIGKKGYFLVKEHYQWEDIVNNVYKIYSNINK